jgi:uncharacterized membrane protein
MTANWAVLVASFLASTVEFVEALTIVLVIGVTINWRSSLLGALLAAGALAVIVAALGPALIYIVPISVLRLVVGVLLVLFGLKWLKKAILRYAGVKALHDEEAIYEEQIAAMKARGEVVHQGIDPFGVVTSFKSVLLEGLEVAFIVITFGSATSTAAGGKGNSIGAAAIGAVAALVLVGTAGLIVREPLARVPENTLKFVVGIMLTTFGTFWGGEGVGIVWPLSDAFLLVLVVIYLAAALALIVWLRQVGKGARPAFVVQAADAQEASDMASLSRSSDPTP